MTVTTAYAAALVLAAFVFALNLAANWDQVQGWRTARRAMKGFDREYRASLVAFYRAEAREAFASGDAAIAVMAAKNADLAARGEL